MEQGISTKGLGLGVVVLAAGLGGGFTQEVERYLSVACLARGECYGRMDWAYWASLMPPLTLAGGMASLLVILFALVASRRPSLRMLGLGTLPDVETTQSIRHFTHRLAGVGALSFMLFVGLAYWFAIW